MKFSKITALICTLTFMTSTAVSAVGKSFPDVNDFQNQTDFLMNSGNSEIAFDMNCDNVINVFDLIIMKQLTKSEKSRYRDNVFESVSIEKDIVFADKKDYQNNSIDLSLDLYQPSSD
ncbi:MAG: hypothetical protein ACI4K5_04265, partial [Ruminococcus sp.]